MPTVAIECCRASWQIFSGVAGFNGGAAYAPALRASRVDPLVALKYE